MIAMFFLGKFSKIIYKFIIFLTLLLLSLACTSSQSLKSRASKLDPIEKLQLDIEKILQDSSLYQSRVGIKVISLETDEILFAENNQQLFHPASNMKLLTTATALKKLGPDYTFPTIIYADSNTVSDGIVNGNLYLKGYGNPDLKTVDLEQMINELSKKQISQIKGNLIFDDFFFDSLYYGAGWMWDDASAWEFAPIHALSVNDNCVLVSVKPGERIGDTLAVQITPSMEYMELDNRGITVDTLDTLMLKKFKTERDWVIPQNIIRITGGMAPNAAPEEDKIEVIDGAKYTANLFAELLRKKNIGINGQIYRAKVPVNAQVLVKHLSEQLSLVVYNTNKISDNLSAEMILKTIGANEKGLPGTANKGISVIYEYLYQLGFDSSTYNLADGSGVSRYNLITPDLLVELLKDMDKDFKIQAEFSASLPIAGSDGTLEYRMKDLTVYKKLRAKTGTLRGVSTLSGYTTTGDDEKIAFSIMMEHFVIGASKIRKIQDRIGDLISGFSRETVNRRSESQ